jgi:Fe-S-cluster containining protein
MKAQQPQQAIGQLFNRTECSCQMCKNNCKVIPGYLIWSDLREIYSFLNPTVNFEQFIKLYFLASKGAIVGVADKIFRIPTIVPRRNNKGYCIFFDNNERCKIHKVSPFGCRYFDCKQTKQEADNISAFGLNLIIKDKEYSQVWQKLFEDGLIAIPPEQARQQFVNHGWNVLPS